jgi:anti-sigma factor RsiW
MKCAAVYRFICDNLDENIRSARCRAIRKHIACCPSCHAYLDSVKKTVLLYQEAPPPPVPRSAHRSLMLALEREIHGTEPRNRARKRSAKGSRKG